MSKQNKPFITDPVLDFLLNMSDSQIKAFDNYFEDSEDEDLNLEEIDTTEVIPD